MSSKLRTITITPSGTSAPMPGDGVLSRTYPIGRRYQLTISQSVGDLALVQTVQRMQVWKPRTPTWDDLNKGERVDYRTARNAFAQLVADTTGKDVVVIERED